MRVRNFVFALLLLLAVTAPAFGQANGKLQIHFMDVGQGDGAILISPQGETVLFDTGVRNQCDKPLSYLQQLGLTQIDYHVASHYHDDHIGCTNAVLSQLPLQKQAIDRGGSYHTATFTGYLNAVGTKRVTATVGMRIVLDGTTANPVTVEIVSVNGEGVATTNENDLSVSAVVRFGNFDAEIGGDLSGFKDASYEDIESLVAARVGQVELYKVHHHGSRYSSNDFWLQTIRPKVGIVSAGFGNKHNHPTDECMERLHTHGIKTYWTSLGGEAEPEVGNDVVGGNIIVEVDPGASSFAVRTSFVSGFDTYTTWETGPAGPSPQPTTYTYVWSKKSQLYHVASCAYAKNISNENREVGNGPPTGRTLHIGCPR